MRALLVVNPRATTTTERGRDVLVRALRSATDLTVRYTERRGHATVLARTAAEAGVDVVVTLGGDGTVNEAVNGLLTAPGALAGLPGPAAYRLPALAVVPGGSTNVFARALGLPRDWADGTSVILDGLRDGRHRVINLGRADDRYFTFAAGLGLDAAVVRRVEQARLRGRTSTPGLYLRAMVGQLLTETDRSDPPMTLERPGEEADTGLGTVIVQNTAPWTYAGNRPVDPNPDASFDLGLDVLALRKLKVSATTRTVTQLAWRSGDPHGKQVLRLHDLPEFTVISSRPQAFQLDGDYLGERQKVHFVSVPSALRVIC
ncbi:DeoR family transcriptional regulator [Actinoplanes sp. SE50]|uniref:diacylglycerol/lipid kinase family protein n=1 Tax=unclassified Actinoplanes TaxID=2626549 RepID=UPI00023EE06E|nr:MULTISPECIES: diacylglycerol kinase family protein [unclassified Actinoplanes]AEV88437.1 putative lipid kinase yegS-like protein [Actinoplanes sp. SE50/110]ATO86842.1 DeoR family transcriptional regulator [Actinoplanes sp. SE50]SLM04260.1 diacylglycerol kinase [Actinoplanes sp. SE50/110]